jgi:hypothetical protein
MNLIDQYLNAVAAQLPTEERADIIAELRDLILSRIEAREEALGRALEEAEVEAILREVGHPLTVAARYRQGPDSLIGRDLFPYWLFAAKAGLIVLGIGHGITLLLSLAGGPYNFGQDIAQAFHSFFISGLTLLGALTLIGAIMEHYEIKPRWLTRWRVAELGAFAMADPSAWTGGAQADASNKPTKVGRTPCLRATAPGVAREAMWSLIAAGVLLLWWVGLLNGPALSNLSVRGGDVDVTAATVWTVLFAPIAVWLMAGIVADAVTVARPHAIRLRAALKIPVAIGGLWIGGELAKADRWFQLSRDGERAWITPQLHSLRFSDLDVIREASSSLPDMAATLSTILSAVLVVIMISLAIGIAVDAWRLATGSR